EAADAELRIQLRHTTGSTAGHEEAFAFVVVEPVLDLVRALDGIAGRIGEAGDLKDAREAAVRTDALAQRLFDERPRRRRMLGETAELFQNEKTLRPEIALFQRVGEEAEKRIRLRPLLCLAERLGDGDKRLGVTRIAIELLHPERLEIVEFLAVNQRERVVSERHGRHIVV